MRNTKSAQIAVYTTNAISSVHKCVKPGFLPELCVQEKCYKFNA